MHGVAITHSLSKTCSVHAHRASNLNAKLLIAVSKVYDDSALTPSRISGAERFIFLVFCGVERVLSRTNNIIILAKRGLKTSPSVTHHFQPPARILRGSGGGRWQLINKHTCKNLVDSNVGRTFGTLKRNFLKLLCLKFQVFLRRVNARGHTGRRVCVYAMGHRIF